MVGTDHGGEEGFLIAYFSMEVGLETDLPTYSGGLGVLAGDTSSAAGDLGLSMVGITLVHRRGYFRQQLDSAGNQTEGPDPWDPTGRLEPVPGRVAVLLRGRAVQVRAWRCRRPGACGGREAGPVYLLDTDLPENIPRTAASPTPSTAGIPSTGCARSPSSASAGSPSRGARVRPRGSTT